MLSESGDEGEDVYDGWYTIIYGAINKYKGKDIIKLSENKMNLTR